MANEFIKPTKIFPAVTGTIATADFYNRNVAGQSKDIIRGIDADGNYADVDLGDETEGANGALISDLKLRNTAQIQTFDNLGALDETINFGQATESAQGTLKIIDSTTMAAGVDDLEAVTAKKLLELFNASSKASTGFIRIPINIGGAFDEIIIQWGVNNVVGDGNLTVNLPLTYPTAHLQALAAQGETFDINQDAGAGVFTLTTTQLTIRNGVNNAQNMRWLSIGH